VKGHGALATLRNGGFRAASGRLPDSFSDGP
jgi:hypothetical protein